MQFIRRLKMPGLLSFPPDMEPFELEPLNVLIGPNGSGKSNLIETLELLRATPVDFAAAIRDGGGAKEWLWRGENPSLPATIEIETGDGSTGLQTPTGRALRHRLEFTAVNERVEVLDEAIEEIEPQPGHNKPYFYYRFQRGTPIINVRELSPHAGLSERSLKREDLLPDQSVLAQRKDPEIYPEVSWIGQRFGQIQTMREWTFGRYAKVRQPQQTTLPIDQLLPDSSNFALIVNEFLRKDPETLDTLLNRFFPRFKRLSIGISGGTAQLYLHEEGFDSPIPPTRLSDGTIRFIAILVTLLTPHPPPLVCIEEPELGLHPDAVDMFGKLLLEASMRMQLVVTTHSDALVSALSEQPDCIVVCERVGAGTRLKRLNSKRLEQWLEDYGLGDVWRMGELGGNP